MNPSGLQSPLLVLGLGSPHGDDQAGWQLVELLHRDTRFSGRCLPLASPWDVLPALKTGSEVIIVDACVAGVAAGTIHRWPACELPQDCGVRTSSHGGSLGEVFRLARTLGDELTSVVVYGIELESTAPGAPLSPSVRQAVEELAERLRSMAVSSPV